MLMSLTHAGTVYSNVNWEGVQRLAGLPVMAAAMLSWPAPPHDPEKCWHPGKGGGGGHDHGRSHGAHGDGLGRMGNKSGRPWRVTSAPVEQRAVMPASPQPCRVSCTQGAVYLSGSRHALTHPMTPLFGRLRRAGSLSSTATMVETSPTMVEAFASPPPSELAADEEQIVKIQALVRGKAGRKKTASKLCVARWRKLGNSLLMVRRHGKRLRQAKFRLLQRYKASLWTAFEAGLISPATTNLLKDMAVDQMDLLEQGRHQGGNCLPFTPRRRVLARRPLVLWLSRALEILHVRPLSRLAQSLLFGEFRRGYDAAAGYMLVHEELLEEHGHGVPFANEASIDALMRAAVAANLVEVLVPPPCAARSPLHAPPCCRPQLLPAHLSILPLP